jgi:hypothetical protein
MRRKLAFVTIAAVTAISLIAAAQQKKPPVPPPKTAPAPPVKKPPVKPPSGEADAAGPMSTKEDMRPVAAGKDAGTGGAVVEQKTLDGGGRVFRFGEVEVEGRLKSPQIVYFLRRVRAEFAAGDLGHRSFIHELDETKGDPNF